MKTLILIFLLTLTTTTARAQTKPTHHIVFVHGFGGDDRTFGAMPKLIVDELNQQDQKTTFQSHYYRYYKEFFDAVNTSAAPDTLYNSLSKETFAAHLGDFINKEIQNLKPQDKISFICHSQGGLIASIWYMHSAMGNPYFYPPLSKNIDAIITIGTPFWGSKIASAFTDPVEGSLTAPILKAIVGQVSDKYGERQLKDMAFANGSARVFRENLLALSKAAHKNISWNVRMLNVGAVTGSDRGKMLSNLFGGDYEYESDMAVSIPSSRINLVYSKDVVENYSAYQKTEAKSFDRLNLASTYVTRGLHTDVFGEKVASIASVPAACQNFQNCKHDVYKVATNFLLGKEIPQHLPSLNTDLLMGFTLEAAILLPEGIRQDAVDSIEINFISTGKTHRVQVGRYFEPISKVKVLREKDEVVKSDTLHFHFTGAFTVNSNEESVIRELMHAGDQIEFLIKGKGLKPRLVQAQIYPQAYTNIKLNLEYGEDYR